MIYLDNAATTLIKPNSVINEVSNWIKFYSANPGRGGHKLSINAGNKIYQCREALSRLFNISKPENIVFTPNTTFALNLAIKGYVKRGQHIVISGMEHNSVYRPVIDTNLQYTIAKPNDEGLVTVESIKKAVRSNTSLIVVTHASNVVGTINPIKEIGEFAKTRNICFLVDCAQSAGVLDIDVVRDNISMLAFAGHKSLLGPTGTGGLYINSNYNLTPIISGGTGSVSESPYQPDFLPDRFESGTLNVVGIAGLCEGVKYILKNTANAIHNYENQLTDRLTSDLKNMKNIKVYGSEKRVGVVGFSVKNKDSVSFCNMLDSYGIASRGGLHCAPLAHKSLGTNGLVRLSVSCFNTKKEIEKVIDVINKIT